MNRELTKKEEESTEFLPPVQTARKSEIDSGRLRNEVDRVVAVAVDVELAHTDPAAVGVRRVLTPVESDMGDDLPIRPRPLCAVRSVGVEVPVAVDIVDVAPVGSLAAAGRDLPPAGFLPITSVRAVRVVPLDTDPDGVRILVTETEHRYLFPGSPGARGSRRTVGPGAW
jgi:hypothetical protein